MGIRFHCPNGHKLHVKSFLAGKRGVCPQCGTSVEIPMESEELGAGSRRELKAELKAVGSLSNSATALLDAPTAESRIPDFDDIVLPQTSTASTVKSFSPSVGNGEPIFDESMFLSSLVPNTPAPTAKAPAPAAPSPDAAVPNPVNMPPTPVSVSPASPASPAVPTPIPSTAPVLPPSVSVPGAPVPGGLPANGFPLPASMAMAPADPISEAPMAIWYVRPAGGGQYGPARGDVMRKWLGEGRVTTDSLVWREGWPDWRAANKVFPDLGTGPAMVPAVAETPLPETPRRIVRPKKKSSAASAIGIVITLGLVCVVLFAVLVVVLMNTGGAK